MTLVGTNNSQELQGKPTPAIPKSLFKRVQDQAAGEADADKLIGKYAL